MPVTCTGTELGLLVPSPRVAAPQHLAAPFCTAQELNADTEMSVTPPARVGMSTGTADVSGPPSLPELPMPQHFSPGPTLRPLSSRGTNQTYRTHSPCRPGRLQGGADRFREVRVQALGA